MQNEGTVNMEQTHTPSSKVSRPTWGLMFRERYLIGIKGSKKTEMTGAHQSASKHLREPW